MTIRSPQHGFSIVSGLATVVIVAAIATTGLRVGPHFIDFRTIQSIMKGLPTDKVHSMEQRAIRELLRKRFRINNIRDFEVQDILTIERTKGSTIVAIDYEMRESLMFNTDIVIMFEDRYEYR